jgi:exopolyphosphatase/guanosine-5'-triphosphate,3'-diphosphate pyrophosphatase
MRLTSIDIGTNTVLMLIADVESNGRLRIVRDEHSIARLGKGVDENRVILPETFERVLKVLREYTHISETNHSQKIIACGTSALRDARNTGEFVSFVKDRLGFEIRILSGDEEAELTYTGAVADLVDLRHEKNFAVLDIGGGSTELTSGVNLSVKSKVSVDLGSVRLTERFLKKSPPASLDVSHALSFIRREIAGLPPISKTTRLIGVAGTLTTLAAVDLALPSFDPFKVNGHTLTYDAIQSIFNRLRIKTVEELRTIPQILPARADIILAGILILLETMKALDADEITVSDKGLRYGILLKEVDEGRV